MLAIGAPRGRSWGVGHIRLDTWSAAHVLILVQKLTFSPAPLALATVAGPLLRRRAGVPASQVGLADLRAHVCSSGKLKRRAVERGALSLLLPSPCRRCRHKAQSAYTRCGFRLLVMRGGVGWSVPPSVAKDPPGQNLNHLPVHKPIRELEIDEKRSHLHIWWPGCTLTKPKGVVGGTSGPSNCAQDLCVSACMCVHVRLCLCFVTMFLRSVCVFIMITVFRFVCLSFCVCQCCKNHDRRLVYMLSESTVTPPPPSPPL